jgi:predicted esterase
VLTDLPASILKRLPRYPTVPATLMGRLATDSRHRGKRGPQVVNVWPGVAPGSEKWTRKEKVIEPNMDEAGQYGIPDGIQALRVVRQHAAEWGVSPDRIGFLGFSAGAMVASGALLEATASACETGYYQRPLDR